MKKIAINLFILCALLFKTPAIASHVYINDLRGLFIQNKAIILAINIRSFNAKDLNGNDIIEQELGETPGNFINAIERLDEIKKQGINTIHLLPITPVGKVKALGTAGSLYAISSFTAINPQLDDKTNKLTVKQEAEKFINECHKRGIRVIVDIPSCGSYDMYLAQPNLFVTDADKQPQVPMDWTDVRVFKTTNHDGTLNEDVYNLYKNYVDMVQELGVDGIRADVATSKPFEFWSRLINYARSKDPQFLFLAEASDSWKEPVGKNAPFTPYDKLLEAGFDGYYGSFFNLKDWKSSSELETNLNTVKETVKKFNGQKSVIGSFATHDELSPMVVGNAEYAKIIIWLQATLPLNSYFVDGFQTGDTYNYAYANKKAPVTYTDDNYYFVHRGKIDIFNFSRKPHGDNETLLKEFIDGNEVKSVAADMLNKGTLTVLPTDNASIFAYTVTYNKSTLLVIINRDLNLSNSVEIKIKGITPETFASPLRFDAVPIIGKNKISVLMPPGGINILMMNLNQEPKQIKKQSKPAAKIR